MDDPLLHRLEGDAEFEPLPAPPVEVDSVPPAVGALLAPEVLDEVDLLELEARRAQRSAFDAHEEEEVVLANAGSHTHDRAAEDDDYDIRAHEKHISGGQPLYQILPYSGTDKHKAGDEHANRVPDESAEITVLLGRDITQDALPVDDEAALHAGESSRVIKRITLVVMPVFMGYAVLLSLQEKLRRHIGITESGTHDAQVFQFGVSLIFMGDLIFRLSHNVLLSFLRPRSRVYVAYGCVCLSMAIVVTVFYMANSRALWWVYVAYFLGGVGIGTFETNIVSCITPLGHGTKEAAITGMPLGYNGVSIGAFALFAMFPSSVALEAAIFALVLLANVLGACIFATIPDIRFEASEDTALKFLNDIRCHWRQWLPVAAPYFMCMFANMFGVILMSGVVLYIFNAPSVALIPTAHSPTVSKNVFQMLYNVCAFLGDFSSRKVAYRFKRRVHPAWALLLLAVGIGLGLCRVAVLAWPGMFLVMFANGALYASTTKFVDDVVPRQFNLVVLSIWLFIGDCGSYVASALTDNIAAAVG